ncbi:MAG: dTMP kinase [Elusimicrobia bacterium]|nr:dTMP kinase [Elusimicrobiota bacterium]
MAARKRRPRGLFVVLEGPDRSGKSTQAGLLARHLRERGLAVLHTREPGGTGLAEAIRKVLLDTRYTVRPLTELMLYEAARAQHTEDALRPALREGRVVVSERYTLATLAYQGAGRALPEPLIRRLNRIATSGLEPDLTLILDVPDREFHRRLTRRADRLELESRRFRERVREGYRRLARSERRTFLIDADRPVDAVRRDVLRLVERVLARRAGMKAG